MSFSALCSLPILAQDAAASSIAAESGLQITAVSLLFGGPILVAIVYIIFRSAERIVRHGRDHQLRLRMIERGFSAVEIQMVLQQTETDGGGCCGGSAQVPSKPAAAPTPPIQPIETYGV